MPARTITIPGTAPNPDITLILTPAANPPHDITIDVTEPVLDPKQSFVRTKNSQEAIVIGDVPVGENTCVFTVTPNVAWQDVLAASNLTVTKACPT